MKFLQCIALVASLKIVEVWGAPLEGDKCVAAQAQVTSTATTMATTGSLSSTLASTVSRSTVPSSSSSAAASTSTSTQVTSSASSVPSSMSTSTLVAMTSSTAAAGSSTISVVPSSTTTRVSTFTSVSIPMTTATSVAGASTISVSSSTTTIRISTSATSPNSLPTAAPSTPQTNGAVIVGNLPSTRPPPAGPIPRRPFHIVNNCNFPIRVGMTGGALKKELCPAVVGSPECTTNEAGLCFCGLPATPEQRNLAPKQTLKVDMVGDVSGNIYAQTGCQGDKCETGTCDTGYCKPSTGPEGAVSLAEFTINPNLDGTDFYDVSIIDGTNIPVSMGPLNLQGGAPTGRYDCGVSGGRGNWTFKPIVNNLDYSAALRVVSVSGPPKKCKTDAECGGAGICGFDPVSKTTGVCGKKVGYTGLKHLCAPFQQPADLQALGLPPLQCDAPVRKGNLRQLLLCEGYYSQHSGYTQIGADTVDACGCPKWEAVGIDAPASQQCMGDNNEWQTQVFPLLQWMKKGVQDAYTFPFDDMSSTYTCNSNRAKDGYKVEFCPGNTEANYF
ncbi:hypothetical protein HDV05_004065 [Chytridiales sp. JEL 0842]|nr:hypothetical protein HDV05_004065 [Chytridiales sp. JEL 0842]